MQFLGLSLCDFFFLGRASSPSSSNRSSPTSCRSYTLSDATDGDETYTVGATATNPYECNKCKRAFTRSSELTKHIQVSRIRIYMYRYVGYILLKYLFKTFRYTPINCSSAVRIVRDYLSISGREIVIRSFIPAIKNTNVRTANRPSPEVTI